MASDIDAVAVFYDDRSFKYRTWESLDDTQEPKRVVSVAVFHVQVPGSNPNVVMHTGHDIMAFKSAPNGFFIRDGDLPGPGGAERLTERFFRKGASDQIGQDLQKPAASAGGGMRIDVRSMDHMDPNYATLQADAATKALQLRTATPPTEGMY